MKTEPLRKGVIIFFGGKQTTPSAQKWGSGIRLPNRGGGRSGKRIRELYKPTFTTFGALVNWFDMTDDGGRVSGGVDGVQQVQQPPVDLEIRVTEVRRPEGEGAVTQIFHF